MSKFSVILCLSNNKLEIFGAKHILVPIMRNSRQAINLASKFHLIRTAIFTFMIPDLFRLDSSVRIKTRMCAKVT